MSLSEKWLSRNSVCRIWDPELSPFSLHFTSVSLLRVLKTQPAEWWFPLPRYQQVIKKEERGLTGRLSLLGCEFHAGPLGLKTFASACACLPRNTF